MKPSRRFILWVGVFVWSWYQPADAATTLSQKESQNFLAGLSAYEEGDWGAVLQKLRPFLKKKNPLPDYALFMVGVAEREQGKCGPAIPRFVKLRKSYSESVYVNESYFEEAKALLCHKRYAEARERLKQYARTHPPEHRQDESEFVVAKSYYLSGDKEGALGRLKDFWTETTEKELAAEAEKLLREMGVSPVRADRWRRARYLYKLRDWDAAKDLLVELGAQDSYLFAECIFQLKDYVRARKLFENLVQRGEDSQQALERLATINVRLGNYDVALRHNQKLATRFPGTRAQRTALQKIAFLHKDRSDFTKAAEILRDLLQRKLSRQEKRKTLEELAWVTYRSGDWGGSLTNLEELLALKYLKKAERAKYLFWQGKVLEKQAEQKELTKEERKEKQKLVRQTFYDVWHHDRWGYYGLSALRGLHAEERDFFLALKGEDEKRARKIQAVALDDPPSTDSFFHLPRAEALHALGLHRLASREMKLAYAEAKDSPTLLRRTGEMAYAVANYYVPMVIGMKWPGILADANAIWRWIYPIAYSGIVERHAKHRGLDPLLIYSIMRQESAFQEEVISPAGARGLVQIMPGTGRRLARVMGWKGFKIQDLFEPEINIALSTLYLQTNYDLFERRLPMLIASYNAGEAAVARWLPSRRELADWEFIEEIPYRETNNYVKRVLANYWMYQYLYPEARAAQGKSEKI